MYLSRLILVFLCIHLSTTLASICSEENYSSQQCECEEIFSNNEIYLALKCSIFPQLKTHINYRSIEFEFCSNDLDFSQQTFENLTINILRIRHCNLLNLNEQTFANIKQFEKFYFENSTIKSLTTHENNFQDIFSINSFQTLKFLTLKSIHYHQTHVHDKKLNFEYLLQQLPNLHRLELTNILLDSYRYTNVQLVGQKLTYLSLTNTHQTSLVPIEYLSSLEQLLIRQLPEIFKTQPLIKSLKKLKFLKYILFEHNDIKSIDSLESTSLDDIDLTSNSIETIDEYTFEHVPKLRQLTLTNNPLNQIDKNAFCGVEKLQRLSIHIKHRQISPLDNCFLINYPYLKIIQDNQMKFSCNCQLLNIYQEKNRTINRIFKSHQNCLLENQFVQFYELEQRLNCSMNPFEQCEPICQKRRVKVLSTHIEHIQGKDNHSTRITLSACAFFLSAFVYNFIF